jgi:hypothetical protein
MNGMMGLNKKVLDFLVLNIHYSITPLLHPSHCVKRPSPSF